MTPGQDGAMEFRDYLSVLRRRKWAMVLCVLIVSATAVGLTMLQTPKYEASGRLLLEPSQSLFGGASGPYVDESRVDTEIEILQSLPVKDEVRRRLGFPAGISATPVGSTAVIELRARDTIPRRAAAAVNTYGEAYIAYRLQKTVDGLAAASREIEEKISDMRKQISDIDARVAATGRPPTSNAERDALVSQQAVFKQRLDQLDVEKDLKSGGAQLVAPAAEPTSPIGPSELRQGLLGAGVGLVIGIAFAFLFEHLDDSIKNKDDLDRTAPGVPVLGVIPSAGGSKSSREATIISSLEPGSPAAEAYRALRTSIQFMGLNRPLVTLQITSPGASEGKTTTIANLAVALARAGRRVAVISCDLRRPRIHEFFGLSNSVGLTSVLLGETPLSSALQAAPAHKDLFVLPSGPLPPNPSELLSSHRSAEVLSTVAAQVDVVLLDSPPILPVTDAIVLSTKADAVLVVAMAGSTTRRGVVRAAELLRQVGALIVGTVLTNASLESSYAYGYYRAPYVAPNGHAAEKRPHARPNGARASRKRAKAAGAERAAQEQPPRSTTTS